MRGSMDKSKGKAKVKSEETVMQPYVLQRLKLMPTSYISQDMLDEAQIGIYQGEFYTEKGENVKVTVLPREVTNLQKQHPFQAVFIQDGLDKYFKEPIMKIDLQRAWQLQSSITEQGLARITTKDGETVEVHITAELIQEALQFRQGVKDIPARSVPVEYKKVFRYKVNQKESFEDLIHQQLKAPLKIFTQHFEPGKAPRYTQPAKRIALHFTQAILSPSIAHGKYAEYVLHSIQSYATHTSIKKHPVLAIGHMLTRIAYYALGMQEDLQPASTNAQLARLCMAVEMHPEPEISSKPQRSTRRKQKFEGLVLESASSS
ncbi:hypothetical protein L7F22_016508 [Adiantum nelumboides]|nr:hypothetical protein [Adiantum nelumboides]